MDQIFQRLITFTRDGVYRYTLDHGEVLFANQGLIDILDLDISPEEIVGRRLQDLLKYTKREGTVRQALVDTGEIHGFEYSFETLKGRTKWVLHDSFLTHDEQGVPCVDAVVKDITERKQAERALAAEKERLRVTLQSIGDGVIATDAEGRVTLLNAVARQLTGWPLEEALGQPLERVFKIFNEQTRAPVENPAQKVLRHGEVVGLANHTALVARDGVERAIADSGAPIRDIDGVIIGVVLVFRDVTEERKISVELERHRDHLEQEVKERTEALFQVNLRLKDAMDELRRSNRDLEMFAYIVSHDLQEPLRTVKSFAELLAKRYSGKLDEKADQFIDYITTGAARGQAMIQGLLSYSRIHGKGAPMAPTDSGEVLARVLSSLEAALSECGAAVEVGDLPQVKADANQLSLLLQNLITNALKFRQQGAPPRVEITAERQADLVRFSVRDNGVGIEQQHLEQVFYIFRRLHGSEVKGDGLGLALCQRIVERHGGKIWVESVPGQGSTFCFTMEPA